MGDVELVEYTGRELLALAAAVYLSKPDTGNFGRVLKIIGRREDSVLEFASATFAYNTSLVVRDHLMRYRLASFAAAGLRYNEPQDFVLPPEVTDESAAFEIGRIYGNLMREYEGLRDEKLKKEVARYILPCGVRVRYLIRYNFRSLAKDVLPQRLWGPGTQPETRMVVQQMFDLLRQRDQELWDKVAEVYGPGH